MLRQPSFAQNALVMELEEEEVRRRTKSATGANSSF